MTEKEALAVAKKYGLQEEIQALLDEGLSPEDALEDWDIL